MVEFNARLSTENPRYKPEIAGIGAELEVDQNNDGQVTYKEILQAVKDLYPDAGLNKVQMITEDFIQDIGLADKFDGSYMRWDGKGSPDLTDFFAAVLKYDKVRSNPVTMDILKALGDKGMIKFEAQRKNQPTGG